MVTFVLGVWTVVIVGAKLIFGGGEEVVEDKKDSGSQYNSSYHTLMIGNVSRTGGFPTLEEDADGFFQFAFQDDASLEAAIKTLE